MLTFELCIPHPITRPDGQNNNINQYKHAIKVILWLNFVFFSEIITFIQTPEEHWLLRVPDLSAIYSHCDAVLGVILDQPRSHQCQGGSRSVIALCKHCVLCSLYSWLLSSLSLSLRPGLGCGYPDKSAGWLLLLRSDPRVVVTMFASFVWPGPPGVWLETMNGPCLQWPGLTAGHQTGKMIKQTLTQPPPPPPFLFWISELL